MSVLPVEDPLGNAASSVFIRHRLSTDPGSLHLRSHASLARKAAVAQLPFVGQAANYNPLYLLTTEVGVKLTNDHLINNIRAFIVKQTCEAVHLSLSFNPKACCWRGLCQMLQQLSGSLAAKCCTVNRQPVIGLFVSDF